MARVKPRRRQEGKLFPAWLIFRDLALFVRGGGWPSRPGDPAGEKLFSEDLLHCLALREFVDEFIQIADFLHHGILNVFHANTADHARDE